jgi:outer membrane protein insertion porin family/translocation and assembly module TamA
MTRAATWRALLPIALVALAATSCASRPPGRYVIDRVDIDRVAIPGVDSEDIGRGVAESAVEEKIATAPSPRFLAIFPRGVVLDYELFDPYVLERDLARIERIYRARGYYEAHVRAGRVEKTSDGHVGVTVVVQEGTRVDVGDIRVEGVAELPLGDTAPVFASIRRSLRKGSAFDEENYEQAQDKLLKALADRGYAFAKINASADVDLNRHVADVTFTVTPGNTARLGAITVTGISGLPEEPVRRALDLTEGELFSASKLESARLAVLRLGVFSDAEVTPVLGDPASGVVPVEVHLSRSDLHEVRLGGGIELDTLRADWHLLTGWEDRNFLGGLRRLTLDLRPGVAFYPTRIPTNGASFQLPQNYLIQGRARAELRQPGFIEARTDGSIRAEFNMYPVIYPADNTAPSTYVLGYRDLGTGFGLERFFGPFFAGLNYNFQTSFPFGYIFEPNFPYARIGDVPPDPNNQVEFKKVVISYVDLKTTLDFRDDPVNPRKGFFLGNDLQIAGVPVPPNFRGPTTLFPYDVRIEPEARAYFRPFVFLRALRKTVLAMRVKTGFLFPADYGASYQSGAAELNPDDAQLVFFRGFFSGGPNSNRGYPFRGVGSTSKIPFFIPGISPKPGVSPEVFCADPAQKDSLACKFPTGGLTLWESSLELRFPVGGSDLSAAVFCDASDVSRYKANIRLLYPHLSCGVGAHYNTPVGPIRLDVGFPIPGLQALDPSATEAERKPDSSFAVSIGIGEAF